MPPAAKAFENSPLGLYVHVPFCVKCCDYCAFYSEAARRDAIEAWLGGIERELNLSPLPRAADTFFFGGGTPGVLTAKDFEKLGRIVVAANGGVAPREWSVEIAPSTASAEKLRVMREIGVNRISLGVQSFDAATLKILGRIHSASVAEAAYKKIRDAGFDNVNIDMIFAVPGEAPSRWRSDLRRVVALAPEHVSAYCLILETGAPLLKRLEKSPHFDPREKSPEREKALYAETWNFLRENGYAQYEVANHARRGRECVHNLNTWRMHEWLGVGPAAASQIGGRRFANQANLARWLEGLASGVLARCDEVVPRPIDFFADSLIFGLRMNKGVCVRALAERFLGAGATIPAPLEELFKNLQAENYLAQTSDYFAPTPDSAGKIALNADGLLVADAIGEAILEALDT